MLHYNPRHVSSITMLIFRRSNCIITASCIVTLCKRLYSMPVESRLLCKSIYDAQSEKYKKLKSGLIDVIIFILMHILK